jgi:hypothetical protein
VVGGFFELEAIDFETIFASYFPIPQAITTTLFISTPCFTTPEREAYLHHNRSAALIPSYPRNLTSARRESTTRKDARERKKDRKEAETKALLEARREEVRRERTLIEAAVAEEDEGDAATESVLEDNGDGSGKKKSKKQQKKEELARLKALKGQELRRKLEMVSAEGGLGRIGEEGQFFTLSCSFYLGSSRSQVYCLAWCLSPRFLA